MIHDPERAAVRVNKLMLALAGSGAIAFLAWRGWMWCLGWLLGCTASIFNFRWIKRATDSLGTAGAKDRKAVLLGLRYLLLGGGAYVIVRFTAISLPAALAGLFVSVAAVLIEILIELVYARN